MEHANDSARKPVHGHVLTVDAEEGMPRDRSSEHRLWRIYSGEKGSDVQTEGYKSSVIASTTSWHVCSALAMTAGFALLVVNPQADMDRANANGLKETVARVAYISLVLTSITCSTLGVFVAAFFLHDAHMVPAALYSQFAHSMPRCWNVSTPLAFSNLGLMALSLTATPLCYLLYGHLEAILAFVAHVVLVSALEAVHVLRLRMWRELEERCGESAGSLALPNWGPMSRERKLVAILRHSLLLGPSQLPLLLELLGAIFELHDDGRESDGRGGSHHVHY